METSSAKFIFILGLILLVSRFASLNGAYGAGECPKSTPDREAVKLLPCASAAKNMKAAVSSSCCAQIKKLGQNAKCLCAVMLSNTARSSGANPKIAITIPKRCNLARRPVGYKCGHASDGDDDLAEAKDRKVERPWLETWL